MALRNRLIATLGAAGMLAGCQTAQPLQISTKPVELTIVQPVDPQPVTLLDLKVKVINRLNVDEVFKQAAKDQGTDNPVFVVLGTKDYEALALNIQELKRYILQQKQIIAYYKKATAKHAQNQADSAERP